MKKSILVFLIVAACMIFGFATGEAFIYDVFGPDFIPGVVRDDMVILNRFELDGFAHAVVFFNNAQDTAMAVILDPDGNPDFFSPEGFGYAYLWADLLTNDLYGSNNGSTWVFLGKL